MDDSVAVVIPTHNRRRTLGRALDSVMASTHPPDQVCVVDDGSDDGTAGFVRKAYPGVILRRQSNRGVSAARNLGVAATRSRWLAFLGVAATRSRWLAFLDSDDEWLPDKLARQLGHLRRRPGLRMAHCDEIWIRRGVRVNPGRRHAKSGGFIFERCLPLCVISPSAALMERTLFEEAGGFDEDLPACEDYALWLRICSRWPVGFVDRPLVVKHGGHADQLSRRHWGMDRFRAAALDRLLRSDALSGPQRAAAAATLRRMCRILVQGAEKRGRAEAAGRFRALAARHGAA